MENRPNHAAEAIAAIDGCLDSIEQFSDPTLEHEAIWSEIKSWIDAGEITYQQGEQQFYDYFYRHRLPTNISSINTEGERL